MVRPHAQFDLNYTNTPHTGVAILAILSSPNKPLSTIIIEQFRPPVDAYVIELPAGLIDPKESVESTAFRELEEETGYKAESLVDISHLMVCDPGMWIDSGGQQDL